MCVYPHGGQGACLWGYVFCVWMLVEKACNLIRKKLFLMVLLDMAVGTRRRQDSSISKANQWSVCVREREVGVNVNARYIPARTKSGTHETRPETGPFKPNHWYRGVMVKKLDSGIVVSEFELQSRNYVHFRTNTLGKGMNPPHPPIYALNGTTTVFLKGWIWY